MHLCFLLKGHKRAAEYPGTLLEVISSVFQKPGKKPPENEKVSKEELQEVLTIKMQQNKNGSQNSFWSGHILVRTPECRLHVRDYMECASHTSAGILFLLSVQDCLFHGGRMPGMACMGLLLEFATVSSSMGSWRLLEAQHHLGQKFSV